MAQVTVGVSLPQSCARALIGRSITQGVELALSEIDKAGCVLGKPLQVIYEDDQGDNAKEALGAVGRPVKAQTTLILRPQ